MNQLRTRILIFTIVLLNIGSKVEAIESPTQGLSNVPYRSELNQFPFLPDALGYKDLIVASSSDREDYSNDYRYCRKKVTRFKNDGSLQSVEIKRNTFDVNGRITHQVTDDIGSHVSSQRKRFHEFSYDGNNRLMKHYTDAKLFNILTMPIYRGEKLVRMWRQRVDWGGQNTWTLREFNRDRGGNLSSISTLIYKGTLPSYDEAERLYEIKRLDGANKLYFKKIESYSDNNTIAVLSSCPSGDRQVCQEWRFTLLGGHISEFATSNIFKVKEGARDIKIQEKNIKTTEVYIHDGSTFPSKAVLNLSNNRGKMNEILVLTFRYDNDYRPVEIVAKRENGLKERVVEFEYNCFQKPH